MGDTDHPVASPNTPHMLAALVRTACVQAALSGYERAQMDGLCHEGAWECAIEAIRALDLEELMSRMQAER